MNATVEGVLSANARLTGEIDVLKAELDGFTYSVSHDLRAPVRAVLGFARVVADDHGSALDEEGRRLLAVVQSEASRMGDMIDALLALSRIGREAMAYLPVDMAGLVYEVVAERAVQEQSLFDVGDLPGVCGDRVLLRQVWANLLSNAVKFSSRTPTPQLRVWATRDAARVIYHVGDNGVGFDMKCADKLFGVFQTLHRRARFPGTGAVLAMVKRIVHRHGGTVWADAQLDVGATFSFALPDEGTQ